MKFEMPKIFDSFSTGKKSELPEEKISSTPLSDRMAVEIAKFGPGYKNEIIYLDFPIKTNDLDTYNFLKLKLEFFKRMQSQYQSIIMFTPRSTGGYSYSWDVSIRGKGEGVEELVKEIDKAVIEIMSSIKYYKENPGKKRD